MWGFGGRFRWFWRDLLRDASAGTEHEYEAHGSKSA